jgi:hypothetical protein
MGKKKAKGTQLKWVEITPEYITYVPRYLLEQLPDNDWDLNRVYELIPRLVNNPFNRMGLFLEKDSTVKGFMWATINPLSERLHVHILTVDEKYHGKGVIGEATGILNKIKKQTHMKKIVFQTSVPEKFERWGFEKSNQVLMEEVTHG